MKIINRYLNNESLDIDYNNLSNIEYYLFDFDSVVVTYNEETEELKVKLGFVDILQRRKRYKKDFITCAKELGFNLSYVKEMLNEIKKKTELNDEIFQLIKKLKILNKHIIIASNNTPIYIKTFMDHFALNEYISQIWTPESANWHWKPDREYYYQLQKSLNNIPFNKILLIDDEKDNIEMFKDLDGQVLLYDKKRISEDKFKSIRYKTDAIKYYNKIVHLVNKIDINILISKSYLIDKISIIMVDGNEVKKKHDMNFVEGGHDLVYNYIPVKTIWIDKSIESKQWKPIIIHELIERFLMEKYKLKYEIAHEIVNSIEKNYRIKTL